MGQTTYVPRAGTSLKLPYPEYTDPASGPDDFKALADAIDAKMTRLVHSYRSTNESGRWGLAESTDHVIDTYTIPRYANGWAAVHYSIVLVNEATTSPVNWAGYVKGYYNNILFANRRYHSRDRNALLELEINDEIVLTEGQPDNFVLRFDVSFDPGSWGNSHSVSMSNLAFTQFGFEKTA